MKNGKTLLSGIFVLIVATLFAAVLASSYSLPDMPPVIVFTSSTQDADVVAVLTAVAVDSLTNAGISEIEIKSVYDGPLTDVPLCSADIHTTCIGNDLVEKKDCGGDKTCTLTKTIIQNNAGNWTYYAKAKDLGGNVVQSDSIKVSFKGIDGGVNIPPVIADQISESRMSISAIGGVGDSLRWIIDPINNNTFAYKYYDEQHKLEIVRNRTLNLEPKVVDLDGDSLNYEWKINSVAVSNSINLTYNFTELGNYDVTLNVNDGKKTASASWLITVVNETVSGQIIDTDTGQPLAGIKISFVPSSTFNPETNETSALGYESLVEKQIPDAITDANGNYNALLPEGTYHLIAVGSDEKDFDIHINANSDKKHDVEMSEKVPVTNFNAEGHIIHSGKYENDNSYTCGDFVWFTMFGVNNGGTDESITFDVQDHRASGNPDSPIVYTANISNPSESLTVPAGQKLNKMFRFEVPCSFEEGKYDIHVLWNNDTWHKIGNFFVVPDTTAPYVYGWKQLYTYTNQSLEVPYDGENIPQPGTIGYNERVYYYMMEGYNEPKWGVTVCIDKDITEDYDHDGNPANDKEVCKSNPPRFLGPEDAMFVNYSKSGYYNAKITAYDNAGNTNSTYTNVTVYATEQEVDAIADPIYASFIPFWLPLFDNITTIGSSWPPAQINDYMFNITWDRVTQDYTYGDEYITPNDGFVGPNGVNWSQIAALEYQIADNHAGNYGKAIFSMTLDEYNYTLNSFLYTSQCFYGHDIGGPACNSRNFIPEIYSCSPTSISSKYWAVLPCYPQALSINTTVSQIYSVSVRDPNADSFTTHWYLDNNEIFNTEDHNQTYMTDSNKTLVFVSGPSLIGGHKIKAEAFDYSGMNISIPNGPNNIYEWTVTVG